MVNGEFFRRTDKAELPSTSPSPSPSPAALSDRWGYWSTSQDLIKQNQYIISGGSRGLTVYDYSDQYNPVFKLDILNDPVQNIAKSGNYAFVSYTTGKIGRAHV